MSYLIDESNFERFKKKVKTIQNKARKLGVKAPEYKVIRTFEREFKRNFSTYKIPYVEIEIVEDKVAMAGWSFAATIEHRSPANIIRVSLKYEGSADLNFYRSAKSICEHCGTSRTRKNTYIMTSESGSMVQVGTSCIKDFIGHPTAEYYAELYEFVMAIEDDNEERDLSMTKYKPSFSVKDVLEMASNLIRTEGYVSKKMSGTPTSSLVFAAMSTTKQNYEKMFGGKYPEVTESDKEMAQKCIDLVKSFDSVDIKNVFNANLRVLVEGEYIFQQDFGMICYLPEMFTKTLEEKVKRWEKEKAEKESRAKSDFIGSVSEKVTIQATYLGKIYLGYNGFNDSYLHRFKSGENDIVWSSVNNLEDVNVGQVIEITGTVKDHQIYKEAKQTRLTRCKVRVL